jgi:hypothetical protein
MNDPYPEITNISSLAKLFFKTFISLKHLSDRRTIGLHVVAYIVLIKGGASERCDFSQVGKRQFSYGIYN